MSQAPPPSDTPVVDTAEQVYISSLALLKMLKHGRAGVPMEVMGLMLGEFVDDYTVRVIDVFAMPQTGTVSICIFLSHSVKLHISPVSLFDVGCQCRGCGSCVSSQNAGHAEADWPS